jgi:hypothetical protein
MASDSSDVYFASPSISVMSTADSGYNGDNEDEEASSTFSKKNHTLRCPYLFTIVTAAPSNDLSTTRKTSLQEEEEEEEEEKQKIPDELSTQTQIWDDATAKNTPLELQDLPLSVSEKARQLVLLMNSSIMLPPPQECSSSTTEQRNTISTNPSYSAYDVSFRPETLQLLGSKALDLILDILSTDPWNKVHTTFLSDIMGFDNGSISILQNKIIESNGVEKEVRASFILKTLQDLILAEDEVKVNCCQKKSRVDATRASESEPAEDIPTSQQRSLDLTNLTMRGKNLQKPKSIIKRFFSLFKKQSKKDPTASLIATKGEKSLTNDKRNKSVRNTFEGLNDDGNNDILSLGKEIALFVYQWVALMAYDAIQFYGNTRLSLLRRSTKTRSM